MNVGEPLGSVEMALAHARRLLEKNADLAAEQAREILTVCPGHPAARLILGAAHRRGGRVQAALDVLEPLAQENPNSTAACLEVGIARAEAGHPCDAVTALRRAVQLQPGSADGWRLLADCLDAADDAAGAIEARASYIKAAAHDPRLRDAAAALVENKLPLADRRLRAHLAAFPTDVAALRMLAEVAGRLRRYGDAEELLERCLKLAPSFDAARHNLALVLNRRAKPAAAREQLEKLLLTDPENPSYLNLQAAVLANLGDYADSIETYRKVLDKHKKQPTIWMSFGHALRTAGRLAECVDAYRHAIELDPLLGEAYWSLANLKTFRFPRADFELLQSVAQREDLEDENRLHFEFALGKALEDDAQYRESFGHYARANSLRKKLHPYQASETTRFVRRCKQHLTGDFFARHESSGAPAPDPIFVLGLPRAGSTLVEQILASHSMVEGTAELAELPRIAHELAGGERHAGEAHGEAHVGEAPFFENLARLEPEELRRLGEEYLANTRAHRKTNAPFFVDKMPNNCLYVGLIRVMLPNAKIVDVRRHPLACCFSGFKQHFARGQNFAFDLTDIGSYYRDYVDLMAHVDSVIPGAVHRVFHESMIENTEVEVRRLLQYCGLPFEEACLRFYENDRAVRTPSSEQVRRPIFKEGMEQWKNYEPWLGPLKTALGAVLDRYPAVPDFGAITKKGERAS